MSAINLKLEELKIRLDHNSHIGFEFNRGSKWSEFLYFDPSGPRKERLLTSTFECNFYRPSDIPARRAALSFLQAHKRAYIPEEGVFEIIMEVYLMSLAAENPKGLASMSNEALVNVYNELVATLGKPPLKSFKGAKAVLLQRIEALQAELAKVTPAQEAAAAENTAKAAKRLEGLSKLSGTTQSTTKEKKMATQKSAKSAAKATAKPAAKAAKPAAKAAKPIAKATTAKTDRRKLGIGAFCMGLIQKGKTNDEVLTAVKAKFPDANTSAASVAWYRNKLKPE